MGLRRKSPRRANRGQRPPLQRERKTALAVYLLISFLPLVFYTPSPFAEQSSSNFTAEVTPLPEAIAINLRRFAWHPGCPVDINNLLYIRLSYWGFDHQSHHGVLIMNKIVSSEVVAIFQALYQQHFPIARMQPISDFHGDDVAAMVANDTSGFDCRLMTQESDYSAHAYGTAVDINPLLNPYISGSVILPLQARKYVMRKPAYPGMIANQSAIYQFFHQKGWRWGGDWVELKDYQHFEKDFRQEQ